MEILMEPKYLVHKGGTKFYEVIEFYNVEAKRFVVVFRWGGMGAEFGGGSVKVERFTDIRKCQDAARKKLKEKTSGGYQERPGGFGIHAGTHGVDSEVLPLTLNEHYEHVGASKINGILNGLGIDDIFAVADEKENEVIFEELPPEPVRGDDWGSW